MGKRAAAPAGGSSGRKGHRTKTSFGPGNPYRWLKGVSGNPSGTSKEKAAALAHATGRLLAEFVDPWVDLMKYHATKGSAPHAVEAGNRMFGKIEDKHKLELAGGLNVSQTQAEEPNFDYMSDEEKESVMRARQNAERRARKAAAEAKPDHDG
jgi:hypothetical protein